MALLAAAALPAAAPAAIVHAAYYGEILQLSRDGQGGCRVDDSRYLAQVEAGLHPTYLVVAAPAGDPYLLADCAGTLTGLAADTYGLPLVLDLWLFLFDPAAAYDLRPDFESRLELFSQRAQASVAGGGETFNRRNTLAAVIHQEVVESRAGNGDINRAVYEWRSHFDVKTVAGYPVSNANRPLPSAFPWRLDYVATWDYDTADPLWPGNPHNRSRPAFYDPDAPRSLGTKYGRFLARLRPHQRVFVLAAGWHGPWQIGNGWPRWLMKHVGRSFCEFASRRPEAELFTVWLWESRPAEGIRGSAELAGTGIFPFHEAIFRHARGLGADCSPGS